MSDLDTIVIRAPAGTKARWVHHAQAQGLKLSEWVLRSVDDTKKPAAPKTKPGAAPGANSRTKAKP